MPLPAPRDGENKGTFVARFMRETSNDKAFTRQQRLAIAYEAWRKYLKERVRA